ncbi:MAG: uroporphyrinogen-III synthase [Bacteroidota bacterium]|nr:uroporphyrinogen-III synthase [Bacteroidota bacterium]
MLQDKIHILCTRSIDQKLLNHAALMGVDIDTLSYIETMPIVSEELKQKIQSLAIENNTVVFTSMNAVTAVIGHLRSIPQWNVFSMGGVTKELVLQYFGEKALSGSAKNATALCERIIETGKVNKVIFFCGDQRLDELPETLEANGIEVEEYAVYTTEQTPHETQKNYDGILFFSPSAVHSFFSVNTVATDVVFFAIGKTTAATIKTYVNNTVVTSEWPGKEQMVELAINYFTSIKQS